MRAMLPIWSMEDALRPTWRSETTAATLATGLEAPCCRVCVNAAGTYRVYLAGNYPSSEDRYLDTGSHPLALWKITGGPTAATMDTAVAAGEIAFDYPQ